MTKASDNVFPRLLISEGGSTATPASGNVTVYAKADGLLYSKDDAGAETGLSGGGGSLSYLVNQLTGDVAMNVANTFFNGPSQALTEGTWLLTGVITLQPASTDICVIKLWDGTTVAASTQLTFTAGKYFTAALTGVAVVGGGGATWRISAAPQATTTGAIIATPTVNNTGLTNKASTLVAVKIA